MHLTLRQLQVFVHIAQSGSTIAAGDRIGLSQSAVSAALGELEKVLDVSLFDRISKRLLINDHGRALLPSALSLLNSAEQLESRFLTKTPSVFEIGASLTIGNYILPGLLASYWQSQDIPLGIEAPPLKITVANTADIASKVENFELDIGLVEGAVHRVDLSITKWKQDELLIVASPTHPLISSLNGNMATAETLSQANWLLREAGSGTREVLEQELLAHIPQIHSSLEFNDHEAIKRSAAEGLGIACLSSVVVQDYLESGKLVQITTPWCPLTRQFSILMHKQKQLTPGLNTLLTDFLK